MNAKTYGPDVKARALAALLTGERVRVVAREHGIPEGTVKSWRHRLRTGKMQPEKKGRAGVLLLGYLRTSLRSLIAQSEHLAERTREIPAGQLALLYGRLFDRTLRMLELAEGLRTLDAGKKGAA